MNDHAELIDKFIASFEVVAENLDVFETIAPIAAQLAVGPTNEYGQGRWRPIKVPPQVTALDPVYAKLPSRFPPLYEQLVLSYRWADVDLQRFTLLANPTGDEL